jgi:hypothetical protein
MRGITVTLYELKEVGRDAFNAPIYEEKAETVDNVLVGEPSTDDYASAVSVFGKQIQFMLGIPKGDTHDWTDKKVTWTNAQGNTQTVHTFGFPIMGVEANIPGPWHMKVRCEAYG